MERQYVGETKLRHLILFNIVSQLAWKFDEQSISQQLPYIQEYYKIEPIVSQWYSTTFFLAQAAAAIPLAKFGERFGQPLVLRICYGLFSIVQIAQFFITNYPLLIVFRVFAGILIAGAVSNKNGLVTKFPNQAESGKSISISILITNINAIFIPFISGILIDKLFFGYINLIAGIFAFISMVASFQFINNPVRTSKHFDLLGGLFITVAIASTCSFFVIIAMNQYYYLILVTFTGILGGSLFYVVEKRAEDPILPLDLLKNPVSDLLILYALNYVNQGGITFIYPQVMRKLNISSGTIGIVNMISGIILVIFSIIIPKVQTKVANWTSLVVLNSVIILLISLNCFFMTMFYGHSVLYGTSNVAFMTIQMISYKMLLMSVEQGDASKVSGFPTVARSVGNSISLALFASIESVVTQNVPQSQQDWGYRGGFIAIICIVFVEIGITICRIGNREQERGKFGFKVKLLRELKKYKILQDNDNHQEDISSQHLQL
ncbi:Major facilitator superfamily protein [Spironucleus salmonicida]|uniref:Major facilitator superfamily protein n=1 Tax=Spironucleus salmonicida TaxID=348837 RepID=V6LE02_9EUKA|nr:Major facilitator superfamily protein [Spironucleus salmonicida]|eukprot:EST41921.1 Major facilitator superfamily protein [Spironucleus salmonicida]